MNTDSLFCCLLRSLLFGLSKSLLDHFDWCTSFFLEKSSLRFCSIFPIVTFFIGAVQHCCMSSSIEFHFLYHHCHRRKEFLSPCTVFNIYYNESSSFFIKIKKWWFFTHERATCTNSQDVFVALVCCCGGVVFRTSRCSWFLWHYSTHYIHTVFCIYPCNECVHTHTHTHATLH